MFQDIELKIHEKYRKKAALAEFAKHVGASSEAGAEDGKLEVKLDLQYEKEKMKRIQEILIDRMQESIAKDFESFVFLWNQLGSPLHDFKMIFFSLLKTEGDILIEVRDYDRAIKAYKALRNYCNNWEMQEQEMWT